MEYFDLYTKDREQIHKVIERGIPIPHNCYHLVEDESTSNVYLVKDGTPFLMYNRNNFEQMISRKLSYANGIDRHYEIALSVENYAVVDKTFAEVTAKGAVPVMDPTTEPWGQRTCYVADPEGNLIEIGFFKSEVQYETN